ncbi:MAG: hypothetical protein QOF33_4346, partial [Thermomicrobiales bacterium]|nr:hypothetical protein [Thermomicrobiales bacterium]
ADADAPAIAAICRQLEGLPLAIELAASWTRTLDPPTLLARLQPRLPLLTRGARDLPAHQQTMRDCIAWSYDLLAPHEQSLFRCVSVFSGGFTLDAAAFITDRVLSARGPRDAVLDLVASLMDKNLLRWEQSIAGEPRYGMLETIREFGLEQLAGQAELAAARRAHAEHMLALAERAEQELLGPDQVRWLDGLAAEHNNLRVALGWALETGNPDPALRIGTALWRYWTSRGHRREGQTWLECALALERAASPRPRAQALVRLGGLAIDRGDYQQAHDRVAAALQIMRELGDRRGIANCHNDLGVIAADQEDHQRARALHEESLAIRRDLGHRRDLALSLFNLGSVTRDEGDYERAREFYAESLEIWGELGDVSTRAYVHLACGVSARLQGDPTSAAQHARRSLALFREVDDVHGIDSARSELGRLLANEGDNAGAEEQFGAILARIGDGGAEPDTAHNWIEAIEGFGWIALRRDQRPRAAALLAFAAAQRHARGVPFPSPKDRQLHQDAVSLAVLQGGPSWSAAWQSSADRTLDELLNDLFATGDGREAATAPG